MNNPVTPLFQVKNGALITPKIMITNFIIRQLKFKEECADVGGGLVAGVAHLEIIEKSPLSNNSAPWVKVAILGTDPRKILKLSGQEYALKFWKAD
jgi:hypothetical protein